MQRRATVLVLICATSLFAGGCQRPPAEMTQQQTRVIRSAPPEAVLAAAANVLRREFGRVHVDPLARTIETAPEEFRTTTESGTSRDLYRGRSVMRRIAHFSVTPRGPDAVIRLRVDLERRDTERATVLQPPTGGRMGDTPAVETPITRDAATTERQNTVWTPVRRDRPLERALLDDLLQQFAAAPATAPAPPAAPEPLQENHAAGSH